MDHFLLKKRIICVRFIPSSTERGLGPCIFILASWKLLLHRVPVPSRVHLAACDPEGVPVPGEASAPVSHALLLPPPVGLLPPAPRLSFFIGFPHQHIDMPTSPLKPSFNLVDSFHSHSLSLTAELLGGVSRTRRCHIHSSRSLLDPVAWLPSPSLGWNCSHKGHQRPPGC